ncbi:hypothetical protein [Allopontixanthobacter sp.]|uniref:hypothetical protein n=1 Tax=Allopontixanthobacter sp. TaxID=2906452 RepID=UPI002AB9A7BD|nr:hypothetical protein [Allopontixanthobacter sp.]MDZ4307918.1 hypothetical protein [Allopontixanthobacter sp.]
MIALLGLAASPPVLAQERSAADPVQSQEIIVEGDRASEEKAVRQLAGDITRRPPIDKPVSRFYDPFCLHIIGLKSDYAIAIGDRIKDNARAAGAPVAAENCTPNALLIFTKNGRSTVEELREEEPWLFTNLLDYEYRRIIDGDIAAHAWQTTELRGVDGKKLEYQIINGREVAVNNQYQTGRLNAPNRLDMVGAVVLIDVAYLPGKTLHQLADYASLRLLASVDELPPEKAGSLDTILNLFVAPENAPDELTRFDRGYLRAVYGLRPNAGSLSIRDAAVRGYFNED